MSLLDMLIEICARIFGSWWLDNEIQRADTTPLDLLIRFSVAIGVVVTLVWRWFRFMS